MTWIESNGLSLSAAISGTGPSLILIHEFGGDLDSFDAITHLLGGDFRILRYDQRGAGRSEKPRAAYTMADHVADLQGLIEKTQLPPPYFLASAAAGGMIAAGFALARPGDVEAIVFCAPALSVAGARREDLLGRVELVRQTGMRAISETTLSRSYPPLLRGDHAAFEDYQGRFLANDPIMYANAIMAAADSGIGDRLSSLRARSLVLAGRHDGIRDVELVRATAAPIPAAEFRVVTSGHLMMTQTPELIAPILKAFFLGSETI